jgi:hypothetical protein
VVSDVPVDDEAPLVTSGISRCVGAQSFGGAHKGRVCVLVFIGVSRDESGTDIIRPTDRKGQTLKL